MFPSGGDPKSELNGFRNAVKTGRDSYHVSPPLTELNAFRNAVKTARDSERGRPQTQLNAFRNAVKSAHVIGCASLPHT